MDRGLGIKHQTSLSVRSEVRRIKIISLLTKRYKAEKLASLSKRQIKKY